MVVAGFSDACERNKGVILDVLKNACGDCESVLEVGSGTGQHVVYFARSLPTIHWQPADTAQYLPGLQARLQSEAPNNVASAASCLAGAAGSSEISV